MTLRQTIQQNIIIAMKAKDTEKLEVLRYLFSQIKDGEIAQSRKEFSDEQIIKLISNQVKKLEEAIVLYQKGKRDDLIAKNKAEITILAGYLPKQISDEELGNAIDAIISNNQTVTNPGIIIGQAVKQLTGKADNSRIAQMVMKKLKENK